jgi:hypothetical protein
MRREVPLATCLGSAKYEKASPRSAHVQDVGEVLPSVIRSIRGSSVAGILGIAR